MAPITSLTAFGPFLGYSNSETTLCGGGSIFCNQNRSNPENVKAIIMAESAALPQEERALLLAIAEEESGFNPQAKNMHSSAAGVFQLIDKTAKNLGLKEGEVYDTTKNVRAAILLFEEHKRLIAARYPNVHGEARLALLYALHHDGPNLHEGGSALAWTKVIPSYRKYVALLRNGHV